MNKKYLYTLLVFILFGSFLIACNTNNTEDSAQQAVTTEIPPVIETSTTVSAEAIVVPNKSVSLAFESGGRVIELVVQEGDEVDIGQTLIKLDDTDAKAAISVAEAALAVAQANLAISSLDPSTELIAVAEAAVTRAEANLASVIAGNSSEPTAEAISVAEARVNTLRAQLNLVLSGTRSETIRASLANLKQAEIALGQAQTEYDKIAYAADSENAQPIVQALENATLAYEAALANHEALVNGATTPEIAVAQAQLAEGMAALEQTKSGNTTQPTQEQIAVAQAGVLEAEAALAQTKVGPRTEQIAAAEAAVQQAEAALVQARLALDKLELKASIAGTVTNINLEVGEIASPGVPILDLADFSIWRIETDDLTEIDVVKVSPGQLAEVRFDAIPSETFNGTVTRIKPRSETKAGDVTYTVVIDLDNVTDSRLRWGMTTFVEINTE